MSGPIVRSGASPEFSKNWDRIFSGKKGSKQGAGAQPAAKAKKSPKKKGAASAPAKAAKGKAAKKKSK